MLKVVKLRCAGVAARMKSLKRLVLQKRKQCEKAKSYIMCI